MWGHEAKLRPNRDTETNLAIIPDSTQTAIGDGLIKSWHVFAKIVSLHHAVSLQVNITLFLLFYTSILCKTHIGL